MGPASALIHTMSKGHWPSDSGEEVFKGYNPIYGIAVILVMIP